jgi:dipeptidyl-peptidase-4
MRDRFVSVWWIVTLAAMISLSAWAEDERLTIEWILSDEGKSAASVPDYAWLDTGKALLYDKHPPKEERTIESFDPASGKRKTLVDPQKAMKSLTELVELEEPLEELGWTKVLDPQGHWAAYEHEEELFLLDLEASEFIRVGNGGGEETSARFSPDGSSMAFVRDNDLYLWDLETREEKRLTTDGSDTLLNGTVSWVYWEEIFGRNDQGYWWSPDSKAIAYLQTDESGVGLMSYVDFKPNVPRVIHQRYPKTGEANPRVRAGVLDLDSGKTTWIDLGVYPYEYLARVKWLPDGKRLAVGTLDRQQTTLDLFLVDAATGKANHVLRETDEGWINLHDDLYFLEDEDRFVWASERDGYAHLYLYDLDGKLVHQITRGEWAIRASGGVFWTRRAVSHIDEKDDWIYFTALEKSSIEKQLYRIRLNGSGMERMTREDGTHRILFRPDGSYYFDAHSAIDQLPSLSIHRPDGERLYTVTQPRPELLERFDLLPRELFTVATADGFQMPAMMLKPRGFEPQKKYPVVLYVYGGPSAPTVSDSWGGGAGDYYEQILANEGYVVLHVDNRSATAQSKQLENRILHEGYGIVHLAGPDQLAGVQGGHRRRGRDRLALLRHQVGRGVHEAPPGQPRRLREDLARGASQGSTRPVAPGPRHLRRQRAPTERLALHR